MASELLTQIYIGIEVGYFDKKMGLNWKNETYANSKMLHSIKNFSREVVSRERELKVEGLH